jgi:hypothetical protein
MMTDLLWIRGVSHTSQRARADRFALTLANVRLEHPAQLLPSALQKHRIPKTSFAHLQLDESVQYLLAIGERGSVTFAANRRR